MEGLAGIVNMFLGVLYYADGHAWSRDQAWGNEKVFVGIHAYQLILATTALNYLCRTKAKMKGGKDSTLPGFLHAAHRVALLRAKGRRPRGSPLKA